MTVKVRVKMPNGEVKEISAAPGERIEEVLRRNGIIPDSVVILRGNTPIPYTERLKEGDEITAIVAFSGGRLLFQAY